MLCSPRGWQLGPRGCATCLGSCVCALVGWPIAPFLACYVCKQRRDLHSIYPGDVAWAPGDLCCGLCWPAAVMGHGELVASKERLGLLHYPWAYNLPPAGTTESAASKINNRTLFVVGPPNSGKSTLQRKLCTVAGQELGRRHHLYIDIKVAAVPHSSDGPFTLEVWDVPVNCIETALSYQPDFVFLTYDSGDKESFLAAQDLYDKFAPHWVGSQSTYLVATKIDTWEVSADNDLGAFEQTSAEWRAACIELAIEAEQWSKQSKALHFSLVSSPMNEGVKKLLASISYDAKEEL